MQQEAPHKRGLRSLQHERVNSQPLCMRWPPTAFCACSGRHPLAKRARIPSSAQASVALWSGSPRRNLTRFRGRLLHQGHVSSATFMMGRSPATATPIVTFPDCPGRQLAIPLGSIVATVSGDVDQAVMQAALELIAEQRGRGVTWNGAVLKIPVAVNCTLPPSNCLASAVAGLAVTD
jgi:hypothetical protein